MKQFKLLIIIILFMASPQNSLALSDYYHNNKMVRFNYYIDNEIVLLYKLVNWWYSCDVDCQSFLCGREIKLNLIGQNKLSGNLFLTTDFPELQIQIPELKKTIKSIDKKTDITFYDTKIKVKISKLPKQTIKHIKKNLSQIGFIIKGNISGILNSKVLLRKNLKAEKKCNKTGGKTLVHLMDFKRSKIITSFEII
ncbi:MAG: hypothetical protein GY714_28450 [Desulfobacterales bacterium]|nr:hypothetical protein [Desulfobacterales bacterium]